MNVDAYLKRIKSENLKEISLSSLKELQKNHLKTIPFENLSLMIKQPVTLNIENIYNKVINEHRGGFCFELNQLFAWLLNQLGYCIRLVSCRVFNRLTNIYSPWLSHVAILVTLNQIDYLIDVGFSMCYQSPIEFNKEKIQIDLIGQLKIVEDQAENCFTLLRCFTEDLNDWYPMYQFTSIKREINEFQQMLEWVQSPECPRFYNRSITIIHYDDYLLMLVGFRLTKMEFKNGIETSRIDTVLNNKTEVYQLIKTQFNLNYFEHEFEPIDIKE
jgi:N-hydroxyarylamine O-acetyltransferase